MNFGVLITINKRNFLKQLIRYSFVIDVFRLLKKFTQGREYQVKLNSSPYQ